MKRITCLIDNNPSAQQPELLTEHGLSFYIEWEEQKVICDVGNSALFAQNATQLGIPLSEVQQLVLSHGHKDHTGGLTQFVESNEKAEIIAAQALMKYHYYSLRHERKRDISTNRPLLQRSTQFSPVNKSVWINAYMAVVFTPKHPHECPKANHFLTVNDGIGERKDLFEHEIALVIKQQDGLIIVSSCSHNGVLNTIEACQTFMDCSKVNYFIGGMHLIDGAGDDIAHIIQEIRNNYPGTQFVTGHCTGQEAIKKLQQELPEQITTFFSGWQLAF